MAAHKSDKFPSSTSCNEGLALCAPNGVATYGRTRAAENCSLGAFCTWIFAASQRASAAVVAASVGVGAISFHALSCSPLNLTPLLAAQAAVIAYFQSPTASPLAAAIWAVVFGGAVAAAGLLDCLPLLTTLGVGLWLGLGAFRAVGGGERGWIAGAVALGVGAVLSDAGVKWVLPLREMQISYEIVGHFLDSSQTYYAHMCIVGGAKGLHAHFYE